MAYRNDRREAGGKRARLVFLNEEHLVVLVANIKASHTCSVEGHLRMGEIEGSPLIHGEKRAAKTPFEKSRALWPSASSLDYLGSRGGFKGP